MLRSLGQMLPGEQPGTPKTVTGRGGPSLTPTVSLEPPNPNPLPRIFAPCLQTPHTNAAGASSCVATVLPFEHHAATSILIIIIKDCTRLLNPSWELFPQA